MTGVQTCALPISPQKLFTGAEIIYQKDKHYYKLSGSEYKPKQEEDFVFFLDCERRFFECKEAIMRYGEKVYILLPSAVYSDVAKLTFQAFKDKICSHARYSINESGQLDYQKMQIENPCLNKIPGFEARVHNYSLQATTGKHSG